MKISDEERYRRVCSQINLYSERMHHTFERFVQLSLATIGGFLWLKMQGKPGVDDILYVGRWVLPALALLTIVELYFDKTGWWNYRKSEARLLNDPMNPHPVPAPKFPGSARSEIVKALSAMVIGTGGFIWLR